MSSLQQQVLMKFRKDSETKKFSLIESMILVTICILTWLLHIHYRKSKPN